jgi:hypothetical protein
MSFQGDMPYGRKVVSASLGFALAYEDYTELSSAVSAALNADPDFDDYETVYNDNCLLAAKILKFGLYPADTASWSTYDKNVCRFQGRRYKALIGKKFFNPHIFIDGQR